MKNLAKETKVIRVSNAVAAGAADANSSVVDTAGFEDVTFIVAFGAITAGAVTGVKAQQGTAADGSDMADISDAVVAVADDADNKLVVLEVVKPTKRYVRAVVTRKTQNAVIDDVTAILSGGRKLPPPVDSTVVSVTSVVCA